MPGFKTTVYVSHVNDLSDFYVQLTEDEAEIDHLSERLNDTRTRPEYYAGLHLAKRRCNMCCFPQKTIYGIVLWSRNHNPMTFLCAVYRLWQCLCGSRKQNRQT